MPEFLRVSPRLRASWPNVKTPFSVPCRAANRLPATLSKVARSRLLLLHQRGATTTQPRQQRTARKSSRVHNQFSIFLVVPVGLHSIGHEDPGPRGPARPGFAFIMTAYTCSYVPGISVALIWQGPVNPRPQASRARSHRDFAADSRAPVLKMHNDEDDDDDDMDYGGATATYLKYYKAAGKNNFVNSVAWLVDATRNCPTDF